jgi:hypothetical protein
MCPWCKDGLTSSFEPTNDREYRLLCRSHQAEYEGLSEDGLDRMEAAERADMTDLGYFDR